MVAVGVLGIVFILLSLTSILQTCRIDPANPASELINFDNDYLFVNIGLIILTLLGLIALKHKRISLAAVDNWFMIFIMLIVTTVVSLTWVNLTRSMANGDESIILNTAKDAVQGAYTNFHQSYSYYGNYSYFLFYPEKLGFVFFAEMLYGLFGVESTELLFQITNVVALDAVFIGVVLITKHLFKNTSVPNMTAIALMCCLQPMFMTTFTQSYFYSLAFSVWGVYFVVRYIQQDKLLYAGLSALLVALGCLLRASGLIFAVAIVIALCVHAVDLKRYLAFAVAAVMLVCSVGLPMLMPVMYSARSGVKLNTHITRTMDLYSGICESSMAPGWYNGVALVTLRDAGMDMEKGDDVARTGIDARMDMLSSENRLVDFYQKKLTSQFNEPSFQSTWISQVKSHNIPEGEVMSEIVDSVYTGGVSTLLDVWFNYYQMILYVGFTVGLVYLIIRKRTDAQTIILPLTILGGVIYHFLFEAKSQYILPYFILLIPFAMYGFTMLTATLSKYSGWLFDKKKEQDMVIEE